MSVIAKWNGSEIARSDNTVVVEGNHYFPPEDVNFDYLKESGLHTTCPWKGEASYHDILVNGETNQSGAWYYPDPKQEAEEIRDRIAFWRGVKVIEE